MADNDKLAQVLNQHELDLARSSIICSYCTCGKVLRLHKHGSHLAAVVLAHLTAEGWAQGHEEWGYRLAEVHSTIRRSTSRERAEEVARLNPALDPNIFVRRVTDWEPAETGDQK